MFRNYIKTAFRNLRRNNLYALSNLFGLTIGLAACLLIGIYLGEELSYDRFNVHADRIVRATMEYRQAGTVNRTATTGTKVGPQFRRLFPQVVSFARTFISHNVIRSGDKIFDEQRILYADTPFFSIFTFPFLQGDPGTALDAPDKIVLTQSMAQKYFGDQQALNKVLLVGGKNYRVSGVCGDVPENSQIKFDFVTQFLNLGNGVDVEQWWTANWITYFLLDRKEDIGRLQREIVAYMNTPDVRREAGLQGSDYLTYHLEPLKRVHLYSPLSGFEPNSSITYIYMFAVIAVLILVIACANYTNLATAQSARRMSEIGIRKVMGASGRQLFLQFIGESTVISVIAALFAFLLSWALLPYFSELTGKQFTAASLWQPAALLLLAGFTVTVSFFSGLYPAMVLSSMRIMNVLKKGFSFTGGSQLLRKTLIVAQFGISVFLIVYTVIMLQQMHYMQTKDLGYDQDRVLVLPIGGSMYNNLSSLKDAFTHVPGVESVTASYETPEHVQWGDGITATDDKGRHDISLNAMPVDLDFIKTMKMKLIAGRDFEPSDFGLMDTTDQGAHYHVPYIINETLARKIGWTPEQAIGKTIQKSVSGPVVGVVRDFNFNSLHDPIGPLLIFLGRDYSRVFMIRLDSRDVQGTLGRIGAVWKDRITDWPFTYHFLEDSYHKLYEAEQRTSLLFGVAAGLAILLACLGLFGLAAYTTVRRTKEIGIRRVLGANAASITFLIARSFLELVGIAVLIALPVAWWAGHRWLQDFAFRVNLHYPVFLATAVITGAISLGTVGYHSLRAAWANPVKSLRTD